MRSMRLSPVLLACALCVACGHTSPPNSVLCPNGPVAGSAGGVPRLETVFVIVMENHNWRDVLGNNSAPYVNDTLLPGAARSEAYFNPPHVHPSLPNYLWMISGQSFGVSSDGPPSQFQLSSDAQLAHQLESAGISWKAYEEGIAGDACPLKDGNGYAVRHDPFVYFSELTDGFSESSARCIAHVRPLDELQADLDSGSVPRFAFITPNVCNDMHDCAIADGDAFLAKWVPRILGSSAMHNRGALFVTWDEGAAGSDGPIGMILASPLAKPGGYAGCVQGDHSAFLRTIEEGFGLTAFLGNAAQSGDLSDLFAPAP